ncbi:DUF1854 domain-containing protein [Xylophilus rhododendri]|uniref:DUF1854 domain-containing protein n=1 Tax=Xylophilus rhododendri TaxID=2697032 RepID=A0A857J3N5_9BURK|nr:DUF1854 domain-containing protein [Xylophilus rhododendri]QHI97853.1 DUF1854 domain-containing protein [Xylophilus rhododendri]
MPTTHLKLSRDSFGRLLMTDLRAVEEVVTPVRAFPLAAPSEGISLVGSDGHERRWIPHLDELDEASRELIRTELDSRDMIPEIRRIVAVSTFSTPSHWTVETDRGPTNLLLRSEDDLRRLPDNGLLVASGQGPHFLIKDRNALDKPSRKILDRFL